MRTNPFLLISELPAFFGDHDNSWSFRLKLSPAFFQFKKLKSCSQIIPFFLYAGW